jgi:hypothetical protein
MKPRTTLILAVVLVVLCAGYWGARQFDAGREARVTASQQMYSFGPEAVTSLTLDRIDADPIRAVRGEEGQWRLELPDPEIKPLQLLWDRVADNLSKLLRVRVITEESSEEQLKSYGLDIPALEVTAMADGEELNLAFGAQDPTQEYRYAQDSAGAVFLTPETGFFELNRKLEELRHRFLVDNRETPIVRLEFARIWTGTEQVQMENPPEVGEESPRMVVTRETPDDPWRVVEPVEATADQERVQALVSEIQYGMARNFIDAPEDLSDYGLSPAAARISVVDAESGKAQTVYFGHLTESEDGGIYARRPDQSAVFVVDSHILSLFPRSLQDFRDRHLLTRAIGEVSHIAYEGADHSFTLVNDEASGWDVLEDDDEMNQARISTYLSGLKNAASEVFVGDADPATYGLDDPLLTLRITYPDEDSPRVIKIARDPQEESIYYATQDSGDVVRLQEAMASKLFLDPAEFRSRSLFRFPPNQAEIVEMTFEGTAYRFEKRHGRWVVATPADRELQNQRDMAMLLDILSDVKMLRGAAEEAASDAEFGLDEPTLTVRVQTQVSGAQPETTVHGPLTIGGVVTDGAPARYVRMAGREGVYRVDQQVVTGIREALRGVVAAPSN